MSGFIAFVTVIYKHTKNRCKLKVQAFIFKQSFNTFIDTDVFEIFSLDNNYQDVVIMQWYCRYHPIVSFDVWLHFIGIELLLKIKDIMLFTLGSEL